MVPAPGTARARTRGCGRQRLRLDRDPCGDARSSIRSRRPSGDARCLRHRLEAPRRHRSIRGCATRSAAARSGPGRRAADPVMQKLAGDACLQPSNQRPEEAGSIEPFASFRRRCAAWRRRLDNHVHVVRLDRVVHQARIAALAGIGEGALRLAHEAYGAKRGHVVAHTRGHVTRHVARELLAALVRHRRLRTARPACAFPAATPARSRLQLEWELEYA